MELRDVLTMMAAANTEISAFLENTPTVSPSNADPAPNLSRVQEQIEALMLSIRNVSQWVKATETTSLGTAARAEIDTYRDNLARLKAYLLALRSHAETRRGELLAHSRKMHEVLAWCDAVKLSNLE
jgi:hypothetical protein